MFTRPEADPDEVLNILYAISESAESGDWHGCRDKTEDVLTGLASGVYVVHDPAVPWYTPGQRAEWISRLSALYELVNPEPYGPAQEPAKVLIQDSIEALETRRYVLTNTLQYPSARPEYLLGDRQLIESFKTAAGAPARLFTSDRCTLLTDRFGKPADPGYEPDPALLAQMMEGESFIAEMDGQAGLYFEWEYVHNESNDSAEEVAAAWGLPPASTTKDAILSRLVFRSEIIAQSFPELPLWISTGDHINGNRVALCGFIAQDSPYLGRIQEFAETALTADESTFDHQIGIDRRFASPGHKV